MVLPPAASDTVPSQHNNTVLLALGYMLGLSAGLKPIKCHRGDTMGDDWCTKGATGMQHSCKNTSTTSTGTKTKNAEGMQRERISVLSTWHSQHHWCSLLAAQAHAAAWLVIY